MELTTANDFTIYPINECAVTIEFGNAIDESLMARISKFNQALCKKPFPGMYDTVPAYTTLTVFFDPVQVIRQNNLNGKSCFEKVSGYLETLKDDTDSKLVSEGEIISIPVCYGGEFGPDLPYVAKYHQITIDEVVRLHTDAIYKVYMIGFIPGFAYMGGLNDLLETPRKDKPQKVPAGAVGIAGKQTSIYPLETPGGWQVIGQTPVKLFDANRQPPALLKAGDRIKFEPVSLKEFKNYHSKNKVPSPIGGG
jgi:inhibitor of KinA